MAIDKKLQIFDDEGNPVDYDILASDVKFNDGKDLPTKLAEMEEEIGEGGYTPPAGGIPKTDLAPSVQQTLDDVANKVDKVNGKGLSTNDFTTALLEKLSALPDAEQYEEDIADAGKVKTVSVNNGTPATPDQNGNVNINVQAGDQVSVIQPDPADGTFTIRVGSTDYTINLNHTHKNMAKLIVCEESDLPSTLDMDTIYAQVDDADTPTEIQSLWIAGLEFVGGGGGSADDGMPKVTSPKDESTLNLGENSGSGVSKSIVVKAKNLNYGGSTTGLTIEAIGTGLSLSYGQQTGQSSITIPQSNGVVNTEVTVAFGGSGGLDDGELRFKQGSSVLASVVVVVVEALPAGFVADTAWNGDNMVGSDVDKYTAPGYQEGYVTTPFYNVTHQGYKVDLMIKSGCVHGVDIPKVIEVFKTSPSDANTVAAYTHRSDPMRRTLNTDAGLIQNYISATMKRSELRNCYIYDYGAGAYLFAGANVDTSTPPND